MHANPKTKFLATILSSTRKALPSSSQLSNYLTGAAGTAALLAAPQAEAAVASFTFGFGTVLDKTEGQLYWSAGDGQIPGGYSRIFAYHPSDYGYGSYAWKSDFLLGNGGAPLYNQGTGAFGLARFFDNGTVIGGGANGSMGYGFFHHWLGASSNLDFGSDQNNKNIAFRTTTNNYGWANVSWNDAANSLTVNSAYIQTTAGAPITVGDIGAVPEASTSLGLLALGAGGLLTRRRLKCKA